MPPPQNPSGRARDLLLLAITKSFFSTSTTPCGHSAQVIVEEREEQSDGGEKNKDPQTKPTPTNTPSPQAESPPSSGLFSTLDETCETETNGN